MPEELPQRKELSEKCNGGLVKLINLIEAVPQALINRKNRSDEHGLPTDWKDGWNNCLAPVLMMSDIAIGMNESELGQEATQRLMKMRNDLEAKIKGASLENDISNELQNDLSSFRTAIEVCL